MIKKVQQIFFCLIKLLNNLFDAFILITLFYPNKYLSNLIIYILFIYLRLDYILNQHLQFFIYSRLHRSHEFLHHCPHL